MRNGLDRIKGGYDVMGREGFNGRECRGFYRRYNVGERNECVRGLEGGGCGEGGGYGRFGEVFYIGEGRRVK